MAGANLKSEIAGQRSPLLLALMVLTLATGTVWAQVTSTITGSIKDTSSAVVPGTAVTVKNIETGLTRIAETDERGNYRFVALPVGQYEVTAERSGFKMAVRRGITLVLGQEAVVDLTLEVGSVEQQVTVTAEAPLVNTTLSSTAGLVGEQQVKDLPLNGRSFDQLLTLNAGTIDYSSQAARHSFSVVGRRPDEVNYTINGVEYIGASTNGLWNTPSGISGQMLGVDAMREFNVQTDAYGAANGKKAGGQVGIVTTSGTNQLHGSAFEYLRNNALDARNFFDDEIAPFKRNQFGGTLGGPLKRDKLFLFGSYEGFRQRRQGSGVAVVPDLDARRGFLPVGPGNSLIQVPDLKPRMLEYMKLWKEPNGPNLAGGTAARTSDTVTGIREDFSLLRLDYNVSDKDFLSTTFLLDDGNDNTPSGIGFTVGSEILRSWLISVQETRSFTPSVLNVATVGFSRAYAFQSSDLTIDFPKDLRMIEGSPAVGAIRIGGSIVSGATVVDAPPGGSPPQYQGRNFYTLGDDVYYTRGNHSLTFGAKIQRIHDNVFRVTSAGGAVSYASLLTMLQDRPTSWQGVPNAASMAWRYTIAGLYFQDDIKLRPNLSLRLGLREETSSGWNEKTCRGANYFFDQNGDMISEPHVGCSILKENNARFLLQPRAGLAWDPTGTGKWSVRAGFGIHNSIQDVFGWRLTNPPYNGLVAIDNTPLLSIVPISGGLESEPSCTAERVARNEKCRIYSPNGVEPTYKTPTIQEWNFSIERELMTNLMLRVGYNGSEGYHTPTNVNGNQARPVRCNNPAGCVSGGAGTARGLVPQGKEYMAPGPRPNPYISNSYTFFYATTTSYHGLDLTLTQRFSHGLTFRTNYTFSKSFDTNSTIGGTTGTNSPQMTYNRFNLGLNKAVSSYSVKNKFNANFSYELPFGSGKPFGSGATGFWGKLIGGWQWNGILSARDGLPFTPTVGRNISGTGDTRNPDAPDRNPNFSGPVILGKVEQWFDPRHVILPIPGTFGDNGRSRYVGPGLFNVDTSLFKKIPLRETWDLQFRFEAFNVFNRANFVSPNPITFSGNNYSATAGIITDTSTTSRELQFALRLTF